MRGTVRLLCLASSSSKVSRRSVAFCSWGIAARELWYHAGAVEMLLLHLTSRSLLLLLLGEATWHSWDLLLEPTWLTIQELALCTAHLGNGLAKVGELLHRYASVRVMTDIALHVRVLPCRHKEGVIHHSFLCRHESLDRFLVLQNERRLGETILLIL